MKKKNFALRIATGLMMAVLLTTCVISGTFAKYVTTGKGEATATVAKWGVEVTATTTGDGYLATSYTTDSAVNVKSSASQNMLAPGTSGKVVTLTVSGTPEVSARVEYAVTFDLGENWEISSGEYCPLVIKVNETELTCTGTVAEFETAVINQIQSVVSGAEFAAGESIDAALTVEWAWAYYVDADTDKKDTELSNAEAKAGFAISISATVTQVD